MLKTSDLRVRDIINIRDGRRLGFIGDVEVDLETGRITAIVIPPPKFLGLFSLGPGHVIPWERIRKIGSDVILVDLPNGEVGSGR